MRTTMLATLFFVACGKSDKAPAPAPSHKADAAPAQEEPMEALTADLGNRLFQQKGCISCHSVDGSPRVGPTMKGVASRALSGATKFEDGTLAKDLIGPGKTFPEVRDYLIAETRRPSERIVASFPPAAPAFDTSVLTEREMDAIVLYMQSLEP